MSEESTAENPQEKQYYCYYCGFEATCRGMEGHVRLASGGGHGSRGVVPVDYSLKKCKRVRDVETRTFTDKQDLIEHLRDEWRDRNAE